MAFNYLSVTTPEYDDASISIAFESWTPTSLNGTIPNYDNTFLSICGVYGTYLKMITVITTLMFPLMVYLLVFKSEDGMKTYKWLLMNNVVTGFLQVLLFGIWLPVPLLFDQLICAFSLGPSRFNSSWNYLMLEASILLFLNLSLSYVASLIYQYTLIMPMSKLSKISSSPKRFILVYIVYTLLIDAILIFLDTYHRDNSEYLLYHVHFEPVWSTVTSLIANIYNYETSMIAFTTNNGMVIIFGIVLFSTILVETFIILVLSFKLFQTIQSMNTKLHDRVLEMQRMLYRMIIQKIIILVLFFFIPFFVFFLCILKVFTSIYLTMAVFAVMPLYTPCSYVLIILNVKPYKSFICSVFKQAAGLSSSTVSVSTPFTSDMMKKRISIVH